MFEGWKLYSNLLKEYFTLASKAKVIYIAPFTMQDKHLKKYTKRINAGVKLKQKIPQTTCLTRVELLQSSLHLQSFKSDLVFAKIEVIILKPLHRGCAWWVILFCCDRALQVLSIHELVAQGQQSIAVSLLPKKQWCRWTASTLTLSWSHMCAAVYPIN